MTLATTPDRVEVNACCAPMTSLFSRLTSAPVWVRVKNASDICCTCWNTLVRMSKIRPSPIREENQRVPSDSSASRTASPAMTAASRARRCDGAVGADLVDHVAGQQRGRDPDHRGDDGQHQEDRELLAVRRGERHHPAQGARRELLVQHRSVLVHHPPGAHRACCRHRHTSWWSDSSTRRLPPDFPGAGRLGLDSATGERRTLPHARVQRPAPRP